MKDVRVLVLVNSTARRGAELQGAALADELTRAGSDIDLAALTSTTGNQTSVSALGTSPYSPRTLRALRRRASSCDVVIAYGSSTLAACAASLIGTGVPFIYRSIGDPEDWLRGRLHRYRTRMLYTRPAHVAALWDRAGAKIKRLYGVADDRVTTIPNARSEQQFRPASPATRAHARSALGLDDRPAVVFLGSLSPEKQVDHAIRAMALVPEAQLIVAGDGPQRSLVDEMLSDARYGNSRAIGAVDDPTTVLHAADLLIMSSRTEGMPGAIIEAGLCGIPVVAPDVGSIGELVVDGNTGVITSGDSAEQLAAGVRRGLAHRDELGAAARDRMLEHYTWGVVVPLWQQLIERVSEPDRSRSRS